MLFFFGGGSGDGVVKRIFGEGKWAWKSNYLDHVTEMSSYFIELKYFQHKKISERKNIKESNRIKKMVIILIWNRIYNIENVERKREKNYMEI